MTNIINNNPTSAISEDIINFNGIKIEEIGLGSHKIQLSVFPDCTMQVSKKIEELCGLALPKLKNKIENDKLKILATYPNKWLFVLNDSPNFLDNIVDNENIFYSQQDSMYTIIKITGQNAYHLTQQLMFVDLDKSSDVLLTQLANDYNGIVERINKKEDNTNKGYIFYISRSMSKSFWDTLKLLAKDIY